MRNFSIKNYVKKGDIIIFICIGITILLAVVLWYRQPVDAQLVRIYLNSEEHSVYRLDYAREKKVGVSYDGHYNLLSIKDGVVTIIDANCPNHDCMNMGSISQAGDMLVCLPHKVLIRLEGGEQVDAVSY